MEWLPMLLIIMSSFSFIFETASLKNYVTPNKVIGCSDNWCTCLTLQEYASQPNMHFTNDTIFYFESGNHRLNSSLTLTNLHNLTFQGLPGDESANVSLGSLVTIAWKGCWNVEISSITFSPLENFTDIIVFEHTSLAQLSSIPVFGNEYIGYSSIECRHSTLNIRDSNFVRIQGSFGAALLILESCILFTGSNTLLDNSALYYGGSLYIFESVVTLNVNITIQGSILFVGNDAIEGGALSLSVTTLILNGNISFNKAWNSGGALHIFGSYIFK